MPACKLRRGFSHRTKTMAATFAPPELTAPASGGGAEAIKAAALQLPPCPRSYPPEDQIINLENSQDVKDIIAANEAYSKSYVPQPSFIASKKIFVLTCIDPRVNPYEILGLETGQAYIFRNAGARASQDALRSISLAIKFGECQQILLMAHSDCLMQKFTPCVIDELFEESLVGATLVKNCNVDWRKPESSCKCEWENTVICGSATGCVDWLTINKGLVQSVTHDVRKIRKNQFIPPYVPIYGYVFDVFTGKLVPIPSAMIAGRAKPLKCKC